MNNLKKIVNKMKFIINPLTGKKIKVGGPTHKKLLKGGIIDEGKKEIEKEKPLQVINPRTGKKIKVGGPTYNKLIKEGVLFHEEQNQKKKSPSQRKEKQKLKEDVQAFTVNILKQRLKELGLSTKGRKAELLDRYNKAIQKEEDIKIEKEFEVPNEVERGRIEEEKDFCEIKHENVKIGRTLSPVKRKSVEKEPEFVISTKRCLTCFEDVTLDQGLACPQCKEIVCLECKQSLVKTECPHCRSSTSKLFSPESRRRQEKKLEEFNKELEKEKTRWDEEIARELERAINNQYQRPPQKKLPIPQRRNPILPNRDLIQQKRSPQKLKRTTKRTTKIINR